MATEDYEQRAGEIEKLAPIVAAATERWKARKKEVESNRRAFERGITPDSEERLIKAREHRVERAAKVAGTQNVQLAIDLAALADVGKERILNEINDLVSVEFLEHGIEAAMSVGRVECGGFTGTGFLVGPNIMLTNHHVLASEDDAQLATFELDVEENRFGEAKHLQCFKLRPDQFFATCNELDFTFVGVEPHSTNGAPIAAYGWHPLVAGEGKIRIGEGVSIIQHPGGQVKMIALHNSRLIQLHNGSDGEEFCFYSSDTERGSSGSPVFSTRWEVIALHHASVPETNGSGKVLAKSKARNERKEMTVEEALQNPEAVAWVANEGIRVSRLVARFQKLELSPGFDQVRRDLLNVWQRPDVLALSRPKSPGPGRDRGERHAPTLESRRTAIAGQATVDIPITLSIRLNTP